MNQKVSALQACRAWWATSPLPGAIGVLHLDGDAQIVLDALKAQAFIKNLNSHRNFPGQERIMDQT